MTRKVIIIIILTLFLTNWIFSQTSSENNLSVERISYLMDKCLSLLGRPVPSEFRLVEPNSYINNENIIIKTENNLIIVSMTLMVVPESNLESTLAIPVLLLHQKYSFKDPIVGDNNFSYTFKKDKIYAKIQYQELNVNYAIVIGFSEKEMKLF